MNDLRLLLLSITMTKKLEDGNLFVVQVPSYSGCHEKQQDPQFSHWFSRSNFDETAWIA